MNKKVQILLGFFAISIAIAYLFVATSFVAEKKQKQRCKGVSVSVADADERNFVTDADVKSILQSSGQRLVGEPVFSINTFKAEELLKSKSYIKDVEVFTDITGTLNVKIQQRKPVLRINTQGSGFYLDEDGFVFPLSTTYAEYVMVVTGTPPLPFTVGYKGYLPKDSSSDFLRKLLEFSQYLSQNSFWNSMIEQINVVDKNNVELIPRIGSQLIKMGSLDRYEYKLHKLNTFYHKGMPAVGWNKYKTINIAYSNQVICK